MPHMEPRIAADTHSVPTPDAVRYAARVPEAIAAPKVLLGLTGLQIDGGIAVVNRCVARVMDEQTRAGAVERVDRVLLLEEAGAGTPAPARGEDHLSHGSQPRFVWQLWRSYRRQRPRLVFLDQVGLARSLLLPLPGFPPPGSAIFAHGIELTAARQGHRARALSQARVLLANSEVTGQQLRSEHPELANRVRVVQLCIDPARTESWEAAGPLPPSHEREPAALIVGRMWSEERGKGHDHLLEAWPDVRRRVPAAQLWIVGGGDDAERLKRKAGEIGIADSVHMLGRVSDEELSELYRRASLFAMPSRQEGFGLVYAEAMWHGLPCIASNADAAGEVIRDGESGELVPYGDVSALSASLISMLSEGERQQTLAAAAQRRARERFTYPRFRRDLLQALEMTN